MLAAPISIPNSRGHKKSGWRMRLPTTCRTSLGQAHPVHRLNPMQPYAVNELPQPQLLAAWGFWKTNPWRISVSSYS